MTEVDASFEKNLQTFLPQLQNIVVEIEKVQSAVTEIKTTTKFIQKRLDQQDEKNNQIKNRNEIGEADFSETFKKNLLELEKKDAHQSEDIKQLISSVNLLNEKVTSLCRVVEVSMVSPRLQDGLQVDVEQTDKHNDNTSTGQNQFSGKERKNLSEHQKGKTRPVGTDNFLTLAPSNVDNLDTIRKQKQNIKSKSVKIPVKKNSKYSQHSLIYVKTVKDQDRDTGKFGSYLLGREDSQAIENVKTLLQRCPKPEEQLWLELIEKEIIIGKSLDLPQGRGPKTVLLLDTSASVAGDTLKRIKLVCNEIISLIEENAMSENIEENLAVVTFGKEVKIAHHFTNDYDSLKSCIDDVLGEAGGPSPLLAGLFVSKGIILRSQCPNWFVKDYSVAPRIILITDGHATDSRYLGDIPDDVGLCNKTDIEEQITKFCAVLDLSLTVFCVPVGSDYNEPLLKRIVASTRGAIFLSANVRYLGRHYKNVMIVVNILNDVPKELQRVPDVLTRYISTTIKNFKEVTEADIEDIKFILDNACLTGSDRPDCNTGNLKNSALTKFTVGTRVELGPDWCVEGGDSDITGTVVAFTKEGQLCVEWDDGQTGKYVVDNGINQVIVSDKPRYLHNELIAVGCLVQRGKNWRYENQDGGPDNVGVVFGVKPTGVVHVRWSNGNIHWYKYGSKGYFEVEVCDPSSVKNKAQQNEPASSNEVKTGGKFKSGAEERPKKPISKSESKYHTAIPTMTTQSEGVVSDNQGNDDDNSVKTTFKVEGDKLVGSVFDIRDKTVHLQDENGQTVKGGNIPEQKSDNMQMTGDNLQVINGDLPVTCGDSPVTHGDLPEIHDDLPVRHGDLPVTHGDLQVTHDNLPVRHSNLLVTHDDLPATHGDLQVTGRDLQKETLTDIKKDNLKFPLHPQENLQNEKELSTDMKTGAWKSPPEQQKITQQGDEPITDITTDNLKFSPKPQENSQQEDESSTNMKTDNLKIPSKPQEKSQQGNETSTDMKTDLLRLSPKPQEKSRQGVKLSTNMKTDDLKFPPKPQVNLQQGDESSIDIKKDNLKFLAQPDKNQKQADDPQQHKNLPSHTVSMNACSSQSGMDSFSSVRSNENKELKFEKSSHFEDSDMISETASVVSDISTVIQTCGIWEWKSRSGNWIPYTSAACQKIEKAYRRSKKTTALVDIDGELCRVVVSKMIHIHMKSRQMTPIRRRESTE